jgi:hypothetical protein
MIVYYSVPEHDAETRYRIAETTWNFDDPDYLAEECAENYHHEHDGWEADWPLTFVLYETKDGPERARMSVDCKPVPWFTATEVETKEAAS